MISDYIKVLTDDATLRSLMFADANNTKFFRLVAPDGETSPWGTYSYSSQGSSEDVIDEATVLISVYAEDPDTADDIMRRIIALLDIYEGAKNTISSADYQFLSSKLVPWGSDTREDDTRLYHLARTFHVTYKRRAGG